MTPPGGGVASVNRHFPNKERMIFIIYPGRFHARNLPGLLHSQSLFFSLKKKSPSGEFFFSAAIGTFGFLFFFPKDDISGCIKVNRDDMCMCAREGGCERVRR